MAVGLCLQKWVSAEVGLALLLLPRCSDVHFQTQGDQVPPSPPEKKVAAGSFFPSFQGRSTGRLQLNVLLIAY